MRKEMQILVNSAYPGLGMQVILRLNRLEAVKRAWTTQILQYEQK
jgi:hypothetical protein